MSDRANISMEKSSKLFEGANEFGKGNIEAFVESSKIAAKGAEALGQEAADYRRRSIETMTTALKDFASVKLPMDLFKLQSDYAKSALEAMVAESAKITEMMLKLAGDVGKPLSSRAAVAAGKLKVASEIDQPLSNLVPIAAEKVELAA